MMEDRVTLKHVDEESLQQLNGRFMECVDIRAAIEEGRFESLDALATHLADLERRMEQTMRVALSGKPVTMIGCSLALRD